MDQVTVLEGILQKISVARSTDGRAIFHDSLKRQILKYIKDSNITATKFGEMSKITASMITRWKRELSKTKAPTRKYKVAKKEVVKESTVKVEMKESKTNPVVKLVYKDVSVFTLLSNLKQVINELTG